MGEIWTVGVVNFVVLACVLRATTKKVVNFLFGGRKVHAQRESWLSLCVWFSSALCYTGLRSWAWSWGEYWQGAQWQRTDEGVVWSGGSRSSLPTGPPRACGGVEISYASWRVIFWAWVHEMRNNSATRKGHHSAMRHCCSVPSFKITHTMPAWRIIDWMRRRRCLPGTCLPSNYRWYTARWYRNLATDENRILQLKLD